MRSMRLETATSGMTGPVQHYPSGRRLFAEGDPATEVFKIVSGVVRTCKFTSDGRRQIHAFYVSGDVFGFESSLERGLSAEAVNDCSTISYKKRRLERLASTDEGISCLLFSYACLSLTKAQDHTLLLGRRSALGRMAAFLIERAECSADRTCIDLPMTRQDIADYLGLTIETVSRSFSLLERDALIELPTARHVRLIDLARLRGLDA